MNSSISSLAIVTDPRLNKTTPFTINYQEEETVIHPYTIEEFNSCLENAPDLFQERFGMTTTEFKSVSDPYGLRKNMLADPNNYVEELLDDLLKEGHLEHGEIYVPHRRNNLYQHQYNDHKLPTRRNQRNSNIKHVRNARNQNTIMYSGPWDA